VLPDTVKFSETVKLSDIVTLSGRPTVTAAVSEPEPDTSISLAVPVIDAT